VAGGVKSKEDILRRIEERMKPLIGNRTEIQHRSRCASTS
jgi:hypothetical protein